MRYLLSCAHTGHCLDWDMFQLVMVCPVCAQRRRLLAIESREWHVKCESCRYGRWCGQSEELAKYRAARHILGHHCSVDYLSFPATKNRVRDMFGRKVRTYIEIPGTIERRLDHPALQLPMQGVIEDAGTDVCPF